MSWHFERCGTKENMLLMLDEDASKSYGIPQDVCDFLKASVSRINPNPSLPGALIYVKSSGHRPMEYAGSIESTEIKLVQSTPYGTT